MDDGDADTAPADGGQDSGDTWLEAVRAGVLRPCARADIATTDVDDELMMYNPADGATHALNLTAALVWESCDGAHTLDEIAQELAGDFKVPLPRARADVDTVIGKLYHLGLLRGAAEDAASPA